MRRNARGANLKTILNQSPKAEANQASQPSWLELQRIVSEQEAARLRGVSVDTLRRQAVRGEGPKRVRLSPRRIGYRLGDVLEAQ
jgi:hypothetical protein